MPLTTNGPRALRPRWSPPTHVAPDEAVHPTVPAEDVFQHLAALTELLTKCQAAPNPKHACVILANELKEFLGCRAVAIGLSRFRQHECRLTAVSGLSRFDAHGEFATAIEAAMDEAVLKGTVTVLPTDCDLSRTATLAHQRATAIVEAKSVVSSPLQDQAGNVLGAWVFFGDQGEPHQVDRTRAFVQTAHGPVGATLNLLSMATESPFRRQLRCLSRVLHGSPIKVVLLASAMLLALMLCPMPYKIGCECQVQPVVRRFVAAPYDGKLEQTFVEPGDQVQTGDLLARLDGRELRWEVAGLEAEFNRAEKSRDAAMAVDRIGEAQQAALEQERLALKIQLIRHRLEHLEVRSPLDGIVVSGDLRKAEGAPLAIGQTMFEIAPLERMLLEVDIPEREVLRVEPGQHVVFRVDANPFEEWSGQIRTVFPQSELRDNASVYIAEVDVEHRSAELRPGMKGRAQVITARHALGWNLFHRPYESFCMYVGW